MTFNEALAQWSVCLSEVKVANLAEQTISTA